MRLVDNRGLMYAQILYKPGVTWPERIYEQLSSKPSRVVTCYCNRKIAANCCEAGIIRIAGRMKTVVNRTTSMITNVVKSLTL